MDLTGMSRDLLTPVRDLGEYIREQRTAAQISLRALAAKAGVSNPYLSQVERGLRRPSAAILAQIADGLSISAESLLVKAGILRSTEATPVITAIRADTDLSERQKSSLVDIYLALRHEALSRHDRRVPTDGAHDDRTPTDQHVTTPTATETPTPTEE
jgi:transcriptional regulator with XRE-family HTH domain